MTATGLIDTGPILALLNHNDHWHRLCKQAFQELQIPLMTSEAVLAEVFHLFKNGRYDLEEVWSFLRQGAVVLAPIHDQELPDIHALMSKYADTPMDFADATLVHLARRESLTTIFTTDSDFEIYRIQGKRKFRIVPSGRP